MADKGIPALTAADRLDGTELIHGVQSTNSRKITTLEISKIPLELKSVGASTYTLVLADANTYIQVDNATAVTLTVPPSIFTAGDEITIEQTGAGVITLTPGAGVTINSRGNRADTNGQFSVVSLKYITASAVTLFGDLA